MTARAEDRLIPEHSKRCPGNLVTFVPSTRVHERPTLRRMDGIRELTVEECWALLEDDEMGRLAFRLVDEVHLVPVNYVVDNRSLLFRTSSGTKLLAAALQSDVAFEIDWHDDTDAWSVVARGRLRQLGKDEQRRADDHRERPWVPSDKPEVIELQPDVVTGRRFRLRRPEPDHAGSAAW